MSDLNLAMVLSLRDKLVGPLRQAVDQVEREFQSLEQQASKTAKATTHVGESVAAVGKGASAVRQMGNELRKVGDDAARANRETRQLEQSARSLARLNLAGVVGGVAATKAFKAVAADPLRQAADYDTALRQLANTAYAGKSLDVRRAGVRTLGAGITAAVRFGGGTREEALEALNELVASGQYEDPNQAAALLPLLMQGRTASGANASSLAAIALRAERSMHITGKEGISEALNRAMAAGNAGGFELPDMAKWLPAQMAVAGSLGLTGQAGFTQLLAANQASVITAGSKDEAGNNLLNLLAKINSQDTAADFKKQGIDLTGSLAAAQGKGMNALDGFVALVDKVVSRDPAFQRAKAAAANSTGTERQAAMDSQLQLLQGSSVGKVVQDRQALLALLALMSNRKYLDDVRGKINAGAKGTITDAAALMTEGAGYIYDQRNFEAQQAQTEAMNMANGAVAKLAEAQINLYQKYPGFATAVEGATVAVSALAAGAAAAGVTNLLMSGGGAAATAAASGSFAATASGAGFSLGLPGAAVAVGGVMAALTAANVVDQNQEAFKGVSDNEMLSAMSGDTGLAAAIMEVAKSNEKRPIEVKVQLDGRDVEATVTSRQDQNARRN